MARASASVVICAYSEQRLDALIDGVGAVCEQLAATDEVIVVIDHNADLYTTAQERIGTRAAIVANRFERGLSGARNTGIDLAGADVTVFLDDDAIPRQGWLDALLEPFEDPQVIGTGGMVSPAWESSPPPWFPEEFLWVVGCCYRGMPEQQAEIRNPIGANMAFRTAPLLALGGFKEGIGRVEGVPLGCEETEWSIRVTSTLGGKIVYVPDAAVEHAVPRSRLTRDYFLARCWAEGRSKALVSAATNAAASVQSERSYSTKTLPAGVLRNLSQWSHGERGGRERAAAIGLGFGVTVAGYVSGRTGELVGRG